MKKTLTLSAAIIFSVNGFSQAPAIQWQKCYGGTLRDEARCVHQTNDGGYIVAGFTFSDDGDIVGHHYSPLLTDDYWIIKLDNNGNMQWQKCLGGFGHDVALSVQQTSDG